MLSNATIGVKKRPVYFSLFACIHPIRHWLYKYAKYGR